MEHPPSAGAVEASAASEAATSEEDAMRAMQAALVGASPTVLAKLAKELQDAYQTNGLPWPGSTGPAPPQPQGGGGVGAMSDDEDEEDEDDDGAGGDEVGAEQGDAEAGAEHRTDKFVFMDFRFGELPPSLATEGSPAHLLDEGGSTLLRVPAGGYLRIPLDWNLWKEKPVVDHYTIIVELRMRHVQDKVEGRSLYQATWPALSAEHDTVGEALVTSSGQVVVGSARATFSSSLTPDSAGMLKWVRLYIVFDDNSVEIYLGSQASKPLLRSSITDKDRWRLNGSGFLLLASSDASYMMAPIDLKRIEVHHKAFTAADVQEHAVVKWTLRGAASASARRRAQQQLTLKALDKKPKPLWMDLSFLAHFCDVFMDLSGGSLNRSVRVVHLGLCEVLTAEGAGLTLKEREPVTAAVELVRKTFDLCRKWERTYTRQETPRDFDIAGVLPFLKLVRRQVQGIQEGQFCMLPCGWFCGEEEPRHYLVMLLHRATATEFTIFVCGLGDNREYHPKTAAFTPKLKYKPLCFKGVPAERIYDEGFWAMLCSLPLAEQRSGGAPVVFELLLPWLHRRQGESVGCDDAALDWRTPTYGRGANTFHRALLDALHVFWRWSGLSLAEVKRLKWHLRAAFMRGILKDTTAVLELSTAEKRLIRMACKQYAYSSAKLCGDLAAVSDRVRILSSEDVRKAKELVESIESKMRVKTSSDFHIDAKLPIVDLDHGKDTPHSAVLGWGLPSSNEDHALFPLFERFWREDLEGKEGNDLPAQPIPPVSFDSLPSSVRTFEELVACIQQTDLLLAQLDNIRQTVRFAHFLKISLVQHIFTRVIPVPLGVDGEAGQDPIWVGGPVAHSTQVDMALTLSRITQHFAMSCASTLGSQGFDGTRCVVLGAIVALIDRLLRGGTSSLSESLQGSVIGEVGEEKPPVYLPSWEVFATQSEHFHFFQPEDAITRARVLDYFRSVERTAPDASKVAHIFEWERDGWVMEYPERGGEQLASSIIQPLYRTAGAGSMIINGYVEAYFPEFRCYRDTVMWWKFYMCTDTEVFQLGRYGFSDGALQWSIGQKWDRRVYLVKTFGEGKMARDMFEDMDLPAQEPHPYTSQAVPSNLLGQKVWSEDDILHIATLPSFDSAVTQADSELLLSYLTVPLLRIPLLLTFFASEDRVHMLAKTQLREVLLAAIFEPGLYRSPSDTAPPACVPTPEPEALGTPFGVLSNDLCRSPTVPLEAMTQLLIQALRMDTKDPHASTTELILFIIRVAARVLHHVNFLLQVARGRHPSITAEQISEGSNATLLSDIGLLEQHRSKLAAALWGNQTTSACAALTGWLDKVKVSQPVCKPVGSSEEDGGSNMEPDLVVSGADTHVCNGVYYKQLNRPGLIIWRKLGEDSVYVESNQGTWSIVEGQTCHYLAENAGMFMPRHWTRGRTSGQLVANMPKLETVLDQETRLACKFHAHRVLVLRTVPDDEASVFTVGSQLDSFVFLTSRHTWNEDTLDVPEPEIFAAMYGARTGVIAWLNTAKRSLASKVLNSVLKITTGMESESESWAKFPEKTNLGRYIASSFIRRSMADEAAGLPLAEGFSMRSVPSIEVNLQTFTFRVDGRHLQALDDHMAKDKDVLHVLGPGVKCMQCSSLGDYDHRSDRRVLNSDVTLMAWDLEHGGLPELGAADREYDPEDLAVSEAWIAEAFEPIRKTYFVNLGMPPKDVQFYLSEQTTPDGHVVFLAGGHPQKPALVWKEVVIYKDRAGWPVVQCFAIQSLGRRKYRVLEFSSNAKLCFGELQPETHLPDRPRTEPQQQLTPWPKWGRHSAFTREFDFSLQTLQPPPFRPSVVIQRAIPAEVLKEENGGSLPATGEPAAGTEESDAASTPVEEFIPARLLHGLLPSALLEQCDFFQDTRPPFPLRGYGKLRARVELVPKSLVPGAGNEGPFADTDDPAICARVTAMLTAPDGIDAEEHVLLNPLTAPLGTPLASLLVWSTRLEDAGHILVWSRRASFPRPTLVQFPKLGLSFTTRVVNGRMALVSADFGGLRVPSRAIPSSVLELLQGIPAAIILEDAVDTLHVLLPNVLPVRPRVKGRPFSTDLVLERYGKWGKHWDGEVFSKYYKYIVHVSGSFLEAPSLASSLYLMLLRFQNRDYDAVCAMVESISTDTALSREEANALDAIKLVSGDTHPDCHACRVRCTLALQSCGAELPWSSSWEHSLYISKLAHVSARCRLDLDDEEEILQICTHYLSKIKAAVATVEAVKGAKRGKLLRLLRNEDAIKQARASEMQEVSDAVSKTQSALRGQSLYVSEEECKRLLATAFRISLKQEQSIPKWAEETLGNRKTVLEAIQANLETLELKLPQGSPSPLQGWRGRCNDAALKQSVSGLSPTITRPARITAARAAIENALAAKFGSGMSIEGEFLYLYRLLTGQTKVKFGAAGAEEEQIRMWSHTYASLYCFCLNGILENGVLASFLLILVHHPELAWSGAPKAPDERSDGAAVERFLADLRSWLISLKEKITWPEASPDQRPKNEESEDAQQKEEADEKKEEPAASAEKEEDKEKKDEAKEEDPKAAKEGDEAASTVQSPTKVVLASMPAKDGFASHGLFKRVARIPACHDHRRESFALPAKDRNYAVDLRPSTSGPWSTLAVVMKEGMAALRDPALLHPAGLDATDLETVAASARSANLPIDLSAHEDLGGGTLSEALLTRWRDDLAYAAAARTERTRLKPDADVIERLREKVQATKSADEALMHKMLSALIEAANDTQCGIGETSGDAEKDKASVEERLRFGLLRYAGQEAKAWPEYCYATVTAAEPALAWEAVNPFLGPAEIQDLLALSSLIMLLSNRVGHASRTLSACSRAASAVKAGEGGVQTSQALQALTDLATARRVYMKEDQVLDPRFMVFEFTRNLVLRSNQYELICSFLDAIRSPKEMPKKNNSWAMPSMIANQAKLQVKDPRQPGAAIVKQLIMGQGKTTVVGPMLCLILADGKRLVTQIVPSALLEMSRSVLRSTFASVLSKGVGTFICERSSSFDPDLAKRLQRATKKGMIIIMVPTAVKSLLLRFLETSLHAQAVASSQKNEVALQVKVFRSGLHALQDAVVLMDECDVLLHPLRSELNFPTGPKEPLDLTSPRALRWALPLHLFDAFFPNDLVDASSMTGKAWQMLDALQAEVKKGYQAKHLQRSPHLVLLQTLFYRQNLMPILTNWLILWLRGQGLFETDRRLTAEIVKSFLQHPPREQIESRAEFANLTATDIKLLNLSRDWLQTFLPHVLQKIDRVSFGIMSPQDIAAALERDARMPVSRTKLAVPFIGKDVPSPTNEFAHPDVIIGLTILAYRYEGLRLTDVDDVLRRLVNDLRGEAGRLQERPSYLLYKTWVEAGGGTVVEPTPSGAVAEQIGAEDSADYVLPLNLLQRSDDTTKRRLHRLFRKNAAVIKYHVTDVFQQHMRFQVTKLSASGQELGSEILFKDRIGFSGTPTDMLPRDLGKCNFAKGDDAAMYNTLTAPGIVSTIAIKDEWSVESLLESVINEKADAFIDTGALITGMSNLEVAQHLARHKSFHKSVIVFLDEADRKMAYVRKQGVAVPLGECGAPVEERFAFYDQVHTTGMDIQHRVDAVAVITLGKDMTWRDYAQGAYRMRGIGIGQTLRVLIIPEVKLLIEDDVRKGVLASASAMDPAQKSLVEIVAWLLCNTIRSEKVQASMLSMQNAANLWRKEALQAILDATEQAPDEDYLKIFEEALDHTIPAEIVDPKSVAEAIKAMGAKYSWLLAVEQKEELLDIMGVTTESTQVQSQDQEQQQEQEQEQEQEVEMERFSDLGFSRDHEKPVTWAFESLFQNEATIASLGVGTKQAKAGSLEPPFYHLSDFHVFRKQPIAFPEEACVSSNYYRRSWQGHRRVRNTVVLLEWVPVASAAQSLESPGWNETEKSVLAEVWEVVSNNESKMHGAAAKELAATVSCDGQPVPHATFMSLLASVGAKESEERTEPPAKKGQSDEALALQKWCLTREHFDALLQKSRADHRERGRFFACISLAEAETLRRVLHARQGRTDCPGYVALRLTANGCLLDLSEGYSPPSDPQCLLAKECFRFLDSQTHFEDHVLPLLLRHLQPETAFQRRHFFEAVANCRRRTGQWVKAAVAKVLELEFDLNLLLQAALSVRIREGLSGKNMSIRAAFDTFDQQEQGYLDAGQTWAALDYLGITIQGADDAAVYFMLMDLDCDGRISYREFHRFVQAAVEDSGILRPPTGAAAAQQLKRGLMRGPREDEDSQLPASPVPGLIRNFSPPASGMPGLLRTLSPPVLSRAISFQPKREAFLTPDRLAELELAQQRLQAKQKSASEAAELKAKTELEEIERRIDADLEADLGPNPEVDELQARWDLTRMRLPTGVVTEPAHREVFENDAEALQNSRKKCMISSGVALPLELPGAFAVREESGRSAIEGFTVTLEFFLPEEFQASHTPLISLTRRDMASWDPGARLVLLRSGLLALEADYPKAEAEAPAGDKADAAAAAAAAAAPAAAPPTTPAAPAAAPGKTTDTDKEKDLFTVPWWPPAKAEIATELKPKDSKDCYVCTKRKVLPKQWHVLSLSVSPAPVGDSADQEKGAKATIWLDGEAVVQVFGLRGSSSLAADAFGGFRLLGGAAMHLRGFDFHAEWRDSNGVKEIQVARGVWQCSCGVRNHPSSRLATKVLCEACSKPKTRSGTRPTGDMKSTEPGLTIVVASSFHELVLSSDKHVFLDVSATWCGPCQQLKPHWKQLAYLLRHCDDITVALMDADENERDTSVLPESHVPVLKLFPKGDKRSPITYKAKRELPYLLRFVEEQTGIGLKTAFEASYAEYRSEESIAKLLLRLAQALLGYADDHGSDLPPCIFRWAQQYLMDPTSFKVDSERPVPNRILPRWVRSLPSEIKVTIVAKDADFERLQAQIGSHKRKDLLGLTGRIMEAPAGKDAITIQLILPEGHGLSRPQDGRGYNREAIREYSQRMRYGDLLPSVVRIHRDALQIQDIAAVEAADMGKNLTKKERARLATSDLSEGQNEELLSLLENLDKMLLYSQPSKPHKYLAEHVGENYVRHIGDLHFISGEAPERLIVRAVDRLAASEVQHSWLDLEKSLVSGEAIPILKDLLLRGMDPDYKFAGYTLLHYAAQAGHLHLIEFLAANGAKLQQRADDGSLPVEVAAWMGEIDALNFFLENGVCFGKALHAAAAGGHARAVERLLESRAQANIRASGFSPVDLAIVFSHCEVLQVLLSEPNVGHMLVEEHVEESACKAMGLRPDSSRLHLAVALGPPRWDVVSLILKEGKQRLSDELWWRAAQDRDGLSILQTASLAFRNSLNPSSSQSWTAAVSTAADDKAAAEDIDPLARNGAGWSVLMWATLRQDVALVTKLLDRKADPHLTRGTLSAVFWAHWIGAKDIIDVLNRDNRTMRKEDQEGLKKIRAAAPKPSSDDANAASAETGASAEKTEEAAAPSEQDSSSAKQSALFSPVPPALIKTLGPAVADDGSELWHRMQTGGMVTARGQKTLASGTADEQSATLDKMEVSDLLKTLEESFPGSHAPFADMEDFAASMQVHVQAAVAAGDTGSAKALFARLAFLSSRVLHDGLALGSETVAPAVQSFRSLLEQGLEALPAYRGWCFRPVVLQGPLRAHRDILEDYAVGQTLSWGSLQSACLSGIFASERLREQVTTTSSTSTSSSSSCSGILFKIRSKTARPVESPTASLKEVVILSTATFRVIRAEPLHFNLLSQAAELVPNVPGDVSPPGLHWPTLQRKALSFDRLLDLPVAMITMEEV